MAAHDMTDCFLLTPLEMAKADSMTIESGVMRGYALMLNAGEAVADAVPQYFPSARKVAVLCGPGNNGGDGYVAARLLRDAGLDVTCFADNTPHAGSDAETAAQNWKGFLHKTAAFSASNFDLIIDALYGAGLDRDIADSDATLINNVNKSGVPVVAVDLPSGISGTRGNILGTAIKASVTITFFRLKPGHLLYPGRLYSGRTICRDIGINKNVFAKITPKTFINKPQLWLSNFPQLKYDVHKYSRGHMIVFAGPPAHTGAARLAARAGARAGAGAVTLMSTPAAMLVNAAQLTSVMLYVYDDMADTLEFIKARKVKTAVLGPGFNDRMRARDLTLTLLRNQMLQSLVLDADAITAFEETPERLIDAIRQTKTAVVLTPHEGEFARLFPDISSRSDLSKLEKAQLAAERTQAVILFKGPDSVIASPDGYGAINCNGTPFLATAGSGDVLSGILAGLLAQDMPPFQATCAAVWLHADAAEVFGPGLVAEDITESLPKTLSRLQQTNDGRKAI